MSLLNTLSRCVLDFFFRGPSVLISWLQSWFTAILEPKKIKSVTVSIFSPSICHKVMELDRLPGGTTGKESASAGDIVTWVLHLGQEDPMKEGVATHTSILAQGIPWTLEPGQLQSIGSQRVGHN